MDNEIEEEIKQNQEELQKLTELCHLQKERMLSVSKEIQEYETLQHQIQNSTQNLEQQKQVLFCRLWCM